MAEEFPIGSGNWWDGRQEITGSKPFLPSHGLEQPLLRGGEAESSFRSAIQEDLNSSASFQQEIGMESTASEYKQINRGFLMEQPQLMDQTAYGNQSTLLQGLISPDRNQQQVQQQSGFDNQPMNYPPNSPPKPHQTPPSQLQFSNNGPFWNATTTDVRSSFFPSLHSQFPAPSFDEKSKQQHSNTSEVSGLNSASAGKKSSSSEASSKRSRSEAPAPLPPFKEEKMGDKSQLSNNWFHLLERLILLQCSLKAIEYIKFLHEQVNVLSTPYMKSGASMQLQQNPGKSKEDEGPKQDLRSRGLCLVPVSSTFPVAHESPVDFWTPTFGGTYR
ncbi:hypothetical protein Vadar_011262 [Vaccinium darrowii]|uniref:Uncharacterized protein n=1 Tax=Vaccinium darrowii TaxID=229202 RepID=A0ACB7Z3Z1_9ERIC|nr:hypothetical protein Vadar_011262 [Vaccinium darrowii]